MGLKDSLGELGMVGRAGADLVALVQSLERHRSLAHSALPLLDHGRHVDRIALGNKAFGNLEHIVQIAVLYSLGGDLGEYLVADIRATG